VSTNQTSKTICSCLELPVLHSSMEILVYRPLPDESESEDKLLPGIILCQHLPVAHAGLQSDPFTTQTAQRLAEAGYVVVVPFLFHWWPREMDMNEKRLNSRDDWTLADLEVTHQWMLKEAKIDNQRIALVGHCWGGRVSWLGACNLPGLAALCTFYGGNINKAMGKVDKSPLQLTASINCPVIGFYGNEDTNPSPNDVDAYATALNEAGVSFEIHRYEQAGHAFQNFCSEERFNAIASDDAWSKLLNFLNENVGCGAVR
jgi:carboxymethylenebutenolidase